MTTLDDVMVELRRAAAAVSEIDRRLQAVERQDQFGSSSIASGDGVDTTMPDLVDSAADATGNVEALESRVGATEEAVSVASRLADEAAAASAAVGADGRAAAEEAAAAADEALEAAKNAGGGNGYQDRAPTPDDQTNPTTERPFLDGAFWFIRSADTGIVTGVYQFQRPDPSGTGTWTQITLNNEVLGELDAGKINTGYLSGERIEADTILGAMIKADEIQGRHIKAESVTAGKLAGDAIDGLTITGATLQTATTGKRLVLGANIIRFYADNEAQAGRIEGMANGDAGALVLISADGTDAGGITIGTRALPAGGTVVTRTPSMWADRVYADGVMSPSNAAATAAFTVDGSVSAETNSNGEQQIAHGLGAVPRLVFLQVWSPRTSYDFAVRVTARTATSFTIAWYYNGDAWANQSVANRGVFWSAVL